MGSILSSMWRTTIDKVLIGIQRFEDTAKGEAMSLKDCFVKVIVERGTEKILGAHIIGSYASVLIQEIINLMYTPEQNPQPIFNGMHIHPALSEVVERAFHSLMLQNSTAMSSNINTISPPNE